MRHGVSVLALGLVLSAPVSGLAQPTGWVTQELFRVIGNINVVKAVNLATGAVEFSLELPAGITVGEGTLTRTCLWHPDVTIRAMGVCVQSFRIDHPRGRDRADRQPRML